MANVQNSRGVSRPIPKLAPEMVAPPMPADAPAPAGGKGALTGDDRRAMRRAYFETKGRLDLLPDEERLPGDRRAADEATTAVVLEIKRVELELDQRARLIR